MYCNFNFHNSVGTQPVRVFSDELFSLFDQIRDSLCLWFPLKELDKIQFNYIIGDRNIIGPQASIKQITLGETFLSAFWNYCFGMVVATPLGIDKGDPYKYCNPYDSLGYCQDLFNGFSKWDLEKLPNPELRRKELMTSIGFSNRVFSMSLYFIIIHEFAHIIRDDIFKKDLTRSEYHMMELSCDTYAFKVFERSTDLNNPEVMFGLLCSMGFLIYVSSFNEKYTKKHPFPDQRLLNLIENYSARYKLEENPFFWKIALWILVTWDFMKNGVFPGVEDSVLKVEPIRKINIKSEFFRALEILQTKKIWEKR